MRVERKALGTQVVSNKRQKPSTSKTKARELKVTPIDPGKHQPLASALRTVFGPATLAVINQKRPSVSQTSNLSLGQEILDELVKRSKSGQISYTEIKSAVDKLDELYGRSDLDLNNELAKALKTSSDEEQKIIFARLLLALDYYIFSKGYLIDGLDRKIDLKSNTYSFWVEFVKIIEDEELEKIFTNIGYGHIKNKETIADVLMQREDRADVLRVFLDCTRVDHDTCLPDKNKAGAQLVLLEYMKKLPSDELKLEDLRELYLNAGNEDIIKNTGELLKEKFHRDKVAQIYLEVAKNDKGITSQVISEVLEDDDDDDEDENKFKRINHFRKARALAINSYAELMKTRAVEALIEIMDSTDDPYIVDEVCSLLARHVSYRRTKGQTKLLEYVKNQIGREEESIPFACIVRRAKYNIAYEAILTGLLSCEFENLKLEKAFSNISNIRLFDFYKFDKDFELEEELPSLRFIFYDMDAKKLAKWMSVGEDIPRTARTNLQNNVRNIIQYIIQTDDEARADFIKQFERLKKHKKANAWIKEMIGLSNVGQKMEIDRPFNDRNYSKQSGVEMNAELN